jgi:hypothetical protein
MGVVVPPAPPAPAGTPVVVVVGAAATKLLVNVEAHVTVLPPPLEEPLHWFIVIGSAVVAPVTVHCTRVLAPPPFPEPLHWVTTAFVVLPTGAQRRVGWIPPPVPEPMHWLTVTSEVANPVGTVSITETSQVRLLPPPTTIPLHWSTDVTSWFDVVTVVVQPEGGVTPAAAKHAVAVTVDEETPAEVTASAMVMVQVTWNPAPVGKAGGSHCAAAGAVAAAEATWVPKNPPNTRAPKAVAVTTTTMQKRRIDSDRAKRFVGEEAKRERDGKGETDSRAAPIWCSLLNPK